MSMTDPIADFLTRIRNGLRAGHDEVLIPHSKMKAEMARILEEQGYIEGWSVERARVGETLIVRLKYTESRDSVISGLLMKLHTVEGQTMLDRVGGVLADVGRVVRSSHEHWN